MALGSFLKISLNVSEDSVEIAEGILFTWERGKGREKNTRCKGGGRME
jgi:hypothetical protein